MKLQAALGASLLFTDGATLAAGQACVAALHLAELLGETEHQLRALWAIWIHRTKTSEHAAALAVAQKFYTLALEHADPAALPIADRMIGLSYHYFGDQTIAWRHVQRMLSADVDSQWRSPLMRFWFDKKVAGQVVLARLSGSGGSPTRLGAPRRAPLATRRRSPTRPRYATPCPTAAAW
jgi:hypothetical protein